MSSFNKVIAIGNLGTEPEMRYTPNGNPVTSFRLATTRVYNSPEGERRQETEWFTIVAWSRLAELCNQYLNKGRRIYVEGRLHSHSWEGRDGVTRFRNEIIASQIVFLDRPQAAALPAGDEEAGAAPEEAPEGDLPFSADARREPEEP